MFASCIELDRSTVNRLVSKDQLLPIHAGDTVLRFLELDGMAAETFATEAEASAWLRRSHPMLDGEAPLAAAQTSFGGQRVKDILLAVKYGGVAQHLLHPHRPKRLEKLLQHRWQASI